MHGGMSSVEEMPTGYLLDEYDELVSCKSLGDYNCCEMISIFIYKKNETAVRNLYTIFTFENRNFVKEKSEYLSGREEKLEGGYLLGIQKKLMKISKVRDIFQLLCDNRKAGKVDIGDGELQIGKLEAVSKVFVQQDSTVEIMLNRVLKNNFYNGSYIMEFFDTDKALSKRWKAEEFELLTEKIYKIIPIDLFSISDRIGNFIFQFPSINIKVDYSINSLEREMTYQVSFVNVCDKDDIFVLSSEGTEDKTVVAFGTKVFSGEGCEETFTVGDASRICRTTVADVKRQLILSRQDSTIIRNITTGINFSPQYGEQRLIYDEKGMVKNVIEPECAEEFSVGPFLYRKRDDFIAKRQYDRRVEELHKRHEFRQYGKNINNNARNDVIAIMNSVQRGSVYLWDPYLTVEDLLRTWYFTTSMNVKLCAITSGELAKKRKMSQEEWIKEQQEIMVRSSNHYGVNAELRCQWAEHGYSFHDRFLMCIPDGEKKVKVWSLGTSVNSLGSKHHVIQSVENPQILADTFDKLWEELDVPECIVWKKGI